jgi:hypothetical protein
MVMSDKAVYRGLCQRTPGPRTVTTTSGSRCEHLPARLPDIRKATVLLRSLFFFAMGKTGWNTKTPAR